MLAEALVCGPPNLLATQHSQISRWHHLKLESHLHFSWGYLGGLLALQLMIDSQLYLCLPTSAVPSTTISQNLGEKKKTDTFSTQVSQSPVCL